MAVVHRTCSKRGYNNVPIGGSEEAAEIFDSLDRQLLEDFINTHLRDIPNVFREGEVQFTPMHDGDDDSVILVLATLCRDGQLETRFLTPKEAYP